MASYNTPILIQKMDVDTEKWSDYCAPHANINKTSGREYFSAGATISASTYNFAIRYCEQVDDILHNTEIYRIVYSGRFYDIKNVDRYAESRTEITLEGDYNASRCQ